MRMLNQTIRVKSKYPYLIRPRNITIVRLSIEIFTLLLIVCSWLAVIPFIARLIFSMFFISLLFLVERFFRSDDESRTVSHNKVIYQLKILKGLASEQGNDVAWFEQFNDDRKRIGDFACYVAYIYALNAR